MSGSRVLWGQITIVITIVLVAIWSATEWTAWRLGFQGQLGSPWFELGGWPVYYPPAFFWWWYSYDAYAPSIFIEGAFIAASGGFISIAVAITLSIIRAREAKNVATYGSARWASPEEVKAAGLLGLDGVVLGRLERDYLRHDGPEHVLCFAPTRSGKGVGLVVPTLLTWPGSVIVHDIKGENWGLTAGFRAGHGRVLLFDPTDAKSSAYNPLLEVRRGDWEVRDVQNIADILVDPIINTNLRTYHMELRSTERTYMASVSWQYPQDQLIALRRQNSQAEAAQPIASGIELANVNFRYSIEGDRAPWRPLRAFDDGRQVFIEFPRGIAQGEMPPLFVVGPEGNTSELVNYRVRGRHMIVDRLFAAAEMRFGTGDNQKRVRITRTDGRPAS